MFSWQHRVAVWEEHTHVTGTIGPPPLPPMPTAQAGTHHHRLLEVLVQAHGRISNQVTATHTAAAAVGVQLRGCGAAAVRQRVAAVARARCSQFPCIHLAGAAGHIGPAAVTVITVAAVHTCWQALQHGAEL